MLIYPLLLLLILLIFMRCFIYLNDEQRLSFTVADLSLNKTNYSVLSGVNSAKQT